jgi:hypothetical protein
MTNQAVKFMVLAFANPGWPPYEWSCPQQPRLLVGGMDRHLKIHRVPEKGFSPLLWWNYY